MSAPLLARVALLKPIPANPLLRFEASALKAMLNEPAVAPMPKFVPPMPPLASARNASAPPPA